MKNILKILLFVTLLSSNVYAETIDVNGLSEHDRAEIALQIAKKKEEQKIQQTTLPKIEELDKYADVGTKIGLALKSAAKELGVAVDDFSKTGLGKITISVLVWKLLGVEIVHVLACLVLILLAITFIYFHYQIKYPKQYTFDETKTNIFGNAKINGFTRDNIHDETTILYIFVICCTIVLCWISIANI